MAQNQEVLRSRRLPDRLRPQLDEGEEALRGPDARRRRRRARSDRRRSERRPGRARRQLRRGALLQAGPPRRVLRRGRSRVQRPAHGAGTKRRARPAASRSSRPSPRSQAGWYDLSCVVGIEQMKTVAGLRGRATTSAPRPGTSKRRKGVEFPFPKLFGKLGDEYDKRYGLKDEHLAGISAVNYANAKLNPLAQTRTWYMNKAHACSRDEFNAAVGGRIRITDCSQVTDGSAAVFLASPRLRREVREEPRRQARVDSRASRAGATTPRA